MLQQKWFKLTMQPSDDIAAHIARLEDVALRLKLMGEEISDSMIMTKILMTLPASYSHIISAWESAPTTERNLVNLTSRLTIEESRHSGHREEESKALASKTPRKGKTQTQHESKNSRDSLNKGKCYRCDKPGHWAKNCPDRKPKDDNDSTHREGHIGEALASTTPADTGAVIWYIDSGASNHMSHHRDWFADFVPFKKEMPVRVEDGVYIKTYGRENINIMAINGSDWNCNYLSNVLYVPKLKYNLFSVGTAMDKGLELQSDKTICKLSKHGRAVAVGVREKKLYSMQFEVM
ncbi:unnamed protein product [Lasius platythorax]|uniref:CCHC-type domain-containing protein n=1 Tax=Lasius platythorax TaxID=488582 RepID=A0AAV2MYH0_9HYME